MIILHFYIFNLTSEFINLYSEHIIYKIVEFIKDLNILYFLNF